MHYKNGREAKIGDHVVGTVYNTPGIVAGVLVSLTAGVEQCNAMVEFFRLGAPGKSPARMQIRGEQPHRVRTANHGSDGAEADVAICRDYTAAGDLLHAEDAFEAHLALERAAEEVIILGEADEAPPVGHGG